MNGIDFLVDTNVIINIKEGVAKVEQFVTYKLAVSFITEIELLGRKDISKKEKQMYSEMLENVSVIGFTDDIKKTCIKLKQQYSIKTPDAIIAATAIESNLPFVTSDNDFDRVKLLDLVKV